MVKSVTITGMKTARNQGFTNVVQSSRMTSGLPIVLRGYDTTEVDTLLRQVDDALSSGRETLLAEARLALRSVQFSLRTRGYARRRVNQLVQQRLVALRAA
jgi:hypothetical protein